jgi:probable biosynthetic protein (TIGR04098 family)
MKKCIEIVKNIIPSFGEESLDRRINSLGIDSIDLLSIRVALEKEYRVEIPDDNWFAFQSIRDMILYLKTYDHLSGDKKVDQIDINISRKIVISMPQMTNGKMSEYWLLKELGDIHWKLIELGIGSSISKLTDECGNRIYATFVRVRYRMDHFNDILEDDEFVFSGDMFRIGNVTHYSKIMSNNGVLKDVSEMMTTFSIRQNSDNTTISKFDNKMVGNRIREFGLIPDFFNESRLVSKGFLRNIMVNGFEFLDSEEVEFRCEHKINAFTEINGVGLLYFAAYPIISDKCLTEYYCEQHNSKTKFEMRITLCRDVHYYANCNSDDVIIFELNSVKEVGEGLLFVTTLRRRSDYKKMAKLFTMKSSN